MIMFLLVAFAFVTGGAVGWIAGTVRPITAPRVEVPRSFWDHPALRDVVPTPKK